MRRTNKLLLTIIIGTSETLSEIFVTVVTTIVYKWLLEVTIVWVIS